MNKIISIILFLLLFSTRPSSGLAPESIREIPSPKGYRFGFHLSWLPDSQRLVMKLVSKNDKKFIPLIAAINVEDESVKILSKPNLKYSYPVCSPDGKWITFIGPMNKHSTLWIMDTQGNNKRRLVDVQCWQRPVWSPDSKRFAFTSRQCDIWVVNLDGSGLNQLSSGAGARSQSKWSPDASQIAYKQNAELWLMNADGSGKKFLTNLVSEPGYESIGTPDDNLFDWSVDGKKIVYAYRPIPPEGKHANRNGQIHPYQIWAVDLNSSRKRCLTPDEISCGLPACLPDGNRILFASTYEWVVTAAETFPPPSYPERNIWTVDFATNSPKQLTKGFTIREFAISPDGRKVAFLTEKPGLFVLLIE